MRRGYLRDCFTGVGVKRLSAVDAEPKRSNQHEVGTTRAMRTQFLGEEQHRRYPTTYIWLGEEQDGLTVEGVVTHYDTREQQPHRAPEWRLYYLSNAVTETMREGDTLFLSMSGEGDSLFHRDIGRLHQRAAAFMAVRSAAQGPVLCVSGIPGGRTGTRFRGKVHT